MRIFVDIDGTLVKKSRHNSQLLECLPGLAARHELYLWSARGADYAEIVAGKLCIAEHFRAIVGKPEAVIDDRGMGWAKYVKTMRGPWR